MVTAEELTDAYEAEIQSRGIPPHPDFREARLSLSAGVLTRLLSKWAQPDSIDGLEGYATVFRRCGACGKTMGTVNPDRPICMACAKAAAQ